MIHVVYQTYYPYEGSREAPMWLPPILNCLVHVIMYTYFAYRASGIKMGSSVMNLIRENITRLQILQFLIILFFFGSINPITAPQCSVGWNSFGWVFFPVFFIMLFFFNFYVQQYLSGKPKTIKNE